jgi:hypothetical protein
MVGGKGCQGKILKDLNRFKSEDCTKTYEIKLLTFSSPYIRLGLLFGEAIAYF